MTTKGNAPGIAAFGFPFRAITTVDINSQKVFVDEAFSWTKRFINPSSAIKGGVSWIIVDGTSIPEDRAFVILPVFFQGFGAGPIFVDFYVNPTYTGAVDWLGANRLGTSSTLTNVKVDFVADPDNVTNEGLKQPAEFMIPSNGVPAVSSFGGQAKDDLILVGRKDIKYAFKLMNQEANPANCVFSLSIFEAALNV